MRSLGIIPVGTALVITLFAFSIGMANERSDRDPNDSKGPMDISSVFMGHKRNDRLIHKLKTFEVWYGEDLSHGGILVYFDTNNDFKIERCLRIYFHRERQAIEAEMEGRRCEKSIAPVHVSRPDSRTVKVVFPKHLLGRGKAQYRWWSETFYAEDLGPCSGETGGCDDRAPNKGRILHRL